RAATRRPSAGEYVRLCWGGSRLGPLGAGATNEAVCLLESTDRRMLAPQFEAVKRRFDKPVLPGTNAHLERLESELEEYFAVRLTRFTVPLVYPGSPCQRQVGSALLAIPYGETCCDAQMARALGVRSACP